MEMNFCRRCGTPLTHVKDHVYTCKNGHTLFANASPAAGIWLLNDKNEVLVATRAQEPGKGALDSPGGFCDGAETATDCAVREMEEELGLKPTDYTTPEFLLNGLDRYEYQGEMLDVHTTIFVARTKGNPVIAPEDDVAKAEFASVDLIDPNDIFLPTPRAAFLKLRDMIHENSVVVKNN
ncbi:MAG TPA: NUDIX domain-containing protein [Candidatus Chromulinivoraceae bacterium]|nr:NUDIX domain-containing protein [Candidatus Chromulinivoraceae bacterium]